MTGTRKAEDRASRGWWWWWMGVYGLQVIIVSACVLGFLVSWFLGHGRDKELDKK